MPLWMIKSFKIDTALHYNQSKRQEQDDPVDRRYIDNVHNISIVVFVLVFVFVANMN